MRKKKSNNKSDYKVSREFELSVASIYENMGYSVTHNTLLSGQQIDILVEKIEVGFGPTRGIIECKYRSSGSLSNQVVYDFLNMFNSIADKNSLNFGVVVTNADFSAPAKQAASENHKIRLHTIHSLTESIFEAATAYKTFINNYKSHPIYEIFVPLRGQIDGTSIDDIVKHLFTWSKTKQSKIVNIIGDFGAGKTTIVTRLKYFLAKEYLKKHTFPKPFLVFLKEFRRAPSLSALILTNFQREFNQNISIESFYHILNSGQLLLLLDGLDEMSQMTGRENRLENVISLIPLFQGKSKVVITCRPSYFVSLEELNSAIEIEQQRHSVASIAIPPQGSPRIAGPKTVDNRRAASQKQTRQALVELGDRLSTVLLAQNHLTHLHAEDSQIIKLSTFNENDIKKYLKNREAELREKCGYDATKLFEYLEKVYDLTNLMKRPILLQMIFETALGGVFDLSKKSALIGPAGLYEAYTEMKLKWDYEKGKTRQLLSTEQRKSLSETVAYAMYREDKPEVSYKEILDLAKDYFIKLNAQLKNVTVEGLAADIRVCTFLTLDEDNFFRFAHKSFMEFFLARYLIGLISSKKDLNILEKPLPREICYFGGSFLQLKPELWEQLAILVHKAKEENKSVIFRNNLANLLLSTPGELKPFRLQDCRISDIDIKKTTMSFSKIINVAFFRTDFEEVEVKDSQFHVDNLEDCRVIKLSCKNASVSTKLINTNVIGLSAENSKSEFLKGPASLTDCNFTKGELIADGNFVFCKAKINGIRRVSAKMVKFERCKINGDVFTFDRSSVCLSSFEYCNQLRAVKTKIEECVFKDTNLELLNQSTVSKSVFSKTTQITAKSSILISSKFSDDCTIRSNAVSIKKCKFERAITLLCSHTDFVECELDDENIRKGSELNNCKFESTKINLKDRRITNATFGDKSVITGNNFRMRKCSYIDSEIRANKCSFVDESQFKGGKNKLSKIELRKVSFQSGTRISMNSCLANDFLMNTADLDLGGVSKLIGGNIKGGRVNISYYGADGVSVEGCAFNSCEIVIGRTSAGDYTFLDKNELKECVVYGILLNKKDLDVMFQKGNNGVVFSAMGDSTGYKIIGKDEKKALFVIDHKHLKNSKKLSEIVREIRLLSKKQGYDYWTRLGLLEGTGSFITARHL